MQKQKNNKNKLKSLTQTTINNYSVTIREQSKRFYPTTQMQAADSNCMIIALKKNVRKNNKAPS